MRAVPKMVEAVTGKRPSVEVHPDEAVALGAALQAAILDQETGARGAAVQGIPVPEIRDVNSHSMGVVALDGPSARKMNSIILKKDTPIPSRVSSEYSTVVDKQIEILVQVTQGESEDVEDVEILGEVTMKLPPYPKGAPIEVFFAYDADGLVHVTVLDLTAKRNLGEMKITRKANLSESDIRKMTTKVARLEVS